MATDNTVRVSLRLKTDVNGAVEKAAADKGVDPATFMQSVIERSIYPYLPNERRKELEMTEELFGRAQDFARKVHDEGRFNADFTLTVIDDMMADPSTRQLYADLIGDEDILKNGMPKKSPLNMYLGLYIKNAINAEPLLDAKGKPRRAFVKNRPIQSYTLLKLN
ncbi:hypothetical protein HHL26_23780 [Sphingobium sp. TB-6]|uniref:hypothetical protein n=1 Tax=Sphingobium sp. TB-6 TaxID=2728850 RepID=UPI00146BE99E|nr:hypothetical protein [Sphingobium sp. TB-6]NML92023.1 hypothetical protein [Sphingobium sp. TB-6]